MEKLQDKWVCKYWHGRPFNPKAQGAIERVNGSFQRWKEAKTLLEVEHKVTKRQLRRWIMMYNNKAHRGLKGKTPVEILYGRSSDNYWKATCTGDPTAMSERRNEELHNKDDEETAEPEETEEQEKETPPAQQITTPKVAKRRFGRKVGGDDLELTHYPVRAPLRTGQKVLLADPTPTTAADGLGIIRKDNFKVVSKSVVCGDAKYRLQNMRTLEHTGYRSAAMIYTPEQASKRVVRRSLKRKVSGKTLQRLRQVRQKK
eukprot:TRINITY_DN67819_c2_g4_i4.p2 TRINITY_DN67819_c2_g4~~TRINITY_DN67819_c2_g4_i4.p2  ORF type:complete len:259 (+),score=44.24 TRINITY_DN67819_c2_g4_i4:1305-2081(+)